MLHKFLRICNFDHQNRAKLNIDHTHRSKRPKDRVVDQHPGLLAKPGKSLSTAQPESFSQRGQDIFHREGAHAREQEDTECDKLEVIAACSVELC